MSTIVRSTSRRLKAVIAVAAIAAALAGCSSSGKWGFPYKAPVQQGNWITSEQVALLRPGMTREQVRFALGSPTLTSVLHADRWDFPYYYKPGYGASVERKFTVYFENDKVTRWDGDQQPDVQPFQLAEEQAKAAAAAKAAGGSGGSQPAAPAPAPAPTPAPGSANPASPSGGGLPAGVTTSGDTPAAASPSSSAPAPSAPAGGTPAGTARTSQPGAQ